MLPNYDVVDMSFGILPWSRIVLLRSGEANVFMEVTAANVQTLSNFVQVQVADPEACADSGSGGSACRNRPFLWFAAGVRAGRIRKVKADKQHTPFCSWEITVGGSVADISGMSRGPTDVMSSRSG